MAKWASEIRSGNKFFLQNLAFLTQIRPDLTLIHHSCHATCLSLTLFFLKNRLKYPQKNHALNCFKACVDLPQSMHRFSPNHAPIFQAQASTSNAQKIHLHDLITRQRYKIPSKYANLCSKIHLFKQLLYVNSASF